MRAASPERKAEQKDEGHMNPLIQRLKIERGGGREKRGDREQTLIPKE